MQTPPVETPFYAVWAYNTFPYFLMAPCTAMHLDGKVGIPSFGWHKANVLKVVSKETGEIWAHKLALVREKERDELKKLNQQLSKEISSIDPFFQTYLSSKL